MTTTVRSRDGTQAFRVSEFRYWSPVAGAELARISMFNRSGHEFWMELEAEDGRAFREARADAAEAIDMAIRLGLEPGEVRVLS